MGPIGNKSRFFSIALSRSEFTALASLSPPGGRSSSRDEVKLGLAQLEFRDQLLLLLEGALGIRQGELGALRWLECDFKNMSSSVQHSYWRRGGHLKSTNTEASAKLLPMHLSVKQGLLEGGHKIFTTSRAISSFLRRN